MKYPNQEMSNHSNVVSGSTDVGDVVRIVVPGLGPYGVTFEEGPGGNAAAVKAWNRQIDGKFGPVQRHGGVRLGDILIAINDTALDNIPFPQVLRMLADDSELKKVLHFTSPEEFQRRLTRKSQVVTSIVPLGAGRGAHSPSFVSVIKRSRISKTQANKKYAEYEVVCTLRTLSSKVQQERVHKWSVWRRYSQFDELNGLLQALLGWQMQEVEFPPKNVFVLDKLAVEFVDNRRRELDRYWQKVMGMPRITDFHKHYCSHELKSFLEIDSHVQIEEDLGGKADSKSPSQQGRKTAALSTTRLRHKAQQRRALYKGDQKTGEAVEDAPPPEIENIFAAEKADDEALIFGAAKPPLTSPRARPQSSMPQKGSQAKQNANSFQDRDEQESSAQTPTKNMALGEARQAFLADIKALRKH